jgi:copper(I)-binding protein
VLKWLIVLFSIMVAIASGVTAHEIKHDAITIVHPWVLETKTSTADLHVKIKNGGKGDERLLRVSTRLAAVASLVDGNGKGVSDLLIPSRGELTLQPGGAHIALSGLKKPLYPYDNFDLTLVFEKAGAVHVDVMVEEKTSDKPGAG